ncbi:MAG: GNAT family N-acetyltransferase [Anaerolineales bacterium]|nr:GNAT family N-acetyltransferase [Anaerolineales bacterium]
MKIVQPAASESMLIRDIAETDFPAVLELNLESVHFLTPLSRARLEGLHRQSAYHKVVEEDGRIVAFILAFREDAEYDSPNFLWFRERYPSFLYIDRLVVRDGCRGNGYGKRLYRDLTEYCRAENLTRITCEVDLDPPNPVSLGFHRKHGFREVGSHSPYDGKKKVLLMEKLLP